MKFQSLLVVFAAMAAASAHVVRVVEPTPDGAPEWKRVATAPGWKRVATPIGDAPPWKRIISTPVPAGAPEWKRTIPTPAPAEAPGWKRDHAPAMKRAEARAARMEARVVQPSPDGAPTW
ncbi:hypothetical protein MVEN_00247900 [Mycena venus]|uniref:Uncharacterized protein n=1 Tax=Mycena venus TaxID=2733690 RepID=A0A8H6YZ64_9AGAR|nr:hypothetical protein MVEN_00247900 [Mycena venus]